MQLIFLMLLNLVFMQNALGHKLYSDSDLEFAKQAVSSAQKSDLAWELTTSLTTEVGPRSAGSQGDIKAVNWAQSALKALGFEKVWIEPVKLKKVWTRGPGQAELIFPFSHTLAIAALGNSISTPINGITAEVVYYESFDALKNESSDNAVGKIVFIDSKMNRTKDVSGYAQVANARFSGAVEASKHGAVAVIIRSIGTDNDRLPHTGTMHYDNKVKPIPAVAVSNPDADLIERIFKSKSHSLVSIHLMTQNTMTFDGLSYNVLAEIRGSEKPEQIVALGAHLDSWDLGMGAVDDAAGVAITITTLKNILDLSLKQGIKPKRTLRLVLFANEENGLDGAYAYNEMHGFEKHQVVVESDLGSGAIYRMGTAVSPNARPWLEEIGTVLTPLNIEMGDNNSDTGADFTVIADDHNIAKVELYQDATYYFDVHHSANDTLDKINPKDLQQNSAAWSALIWLSAQADVDFN